MPSESSSTTRKAILAASLITVLGIVGSRVLGLVRVQLLSILFGAADAGALRAAFDLPDLLYYLVAGGAIRSGFVPIFTELLTRAETPEQRRRAWWLYSVLITWIALIGAVLVLLGEIFTRQLTAPMTGQWSARGFSAEATELTIRLTRIMLPAQIFMLLGGVMSAALNALKHFTVPALVPGAYNLFIILAMVGLGAGHGVTSAAYGVTVGAVLCHWLWQAWAIRRWGAEHGAAYRPALAVRDELVVRVLKIAAPIMLGLCVSEINIKVSGWVIAQFGEAARACFDNASRIARLPDGVFGAGLGIALFPFLSQLAAEGRRDEFRRQFEATLRLALVCSLPCAVFLAVVPGPIIDALFGHGRFSAEDVRQTAQMLPLFGLGVVPITLQVVVTRAFYANQDSLTPVKVGALTVLFGVAANLALGRLMGQLGPPLALSLTSFLNTFGLMWLYHRQFGFGQARRVLQVTWQSLGGSALAGLAAWAATLPCTSPKLAVLPAFGAWLVVYPVLMRWLKVPEIEEILRLVSQRLRRLKAS